METPNRHNAWLKALTRAQRWCESVSKVLDFVVGIPITVTLVLLVCIVFVSVIARYLFSAPIFWVEEISLFLIITVIFLSLRVTFKRGQQLGVSFLVEKFIKYRFFFALASNVTTIVFMAFVTVQAYNFAHFFAVYRAPATGLPFSMLYWVVSLGCALTVIESLLMIVQDLASHLLKRGESLKQEGK